MSAELQALPEGWLTDAEAAFLAEVAKDKVVLEVGAFLGRSTIAMAKTAKLVISVDHHRGSDEHQADGALWGPLLDPATGEPSTARRFLNNLRQAGLSNVITVVAPFEQAAPYIHGCDLVFIDAQHDHASVVRGARAAIDCLTRSAPFVFHDYGTWAGVVSAVAYLQRQWRAVLTAPPGTNLAVLQRSG